MTDGLCRRALAGLQEADSVVINPHKMLHVPLQCSALLFRRGLTLLQAVRDAAPPAPYLFHRSENGGNDGVDEASAGSGGD